MFSCSVFDADSEFRVRSSMDRTDLKSIPLINSHAESQLPSRSKTLLIPYSLRVEINFN